MSSEEIKQIKNHVTSRIDYNESLKIVEEKANNDLHFMYDGSIFFITPELYAFISVWDEEELIIKNAHGNPVMVNRTEFLKLAKSNYQKSMNEWLVAYEKIKSSRKV